MSVSLGIGASAAILVSQNRNKVCIGIIVGAAQMFISILRSIKH